MSFDVAFQEAHEPSMTDAVKSLSFDRINRIYRMGFGPRL
jgi:hypothetical protein